MKINIILLPCYFFLSVSLYFSLSSLGMLDTHSRSPTETDGDMCKSSNLSDCSACEMRQQRKNNESYQISIYLCSLLGLSLYLSLWFCLCSNAILAIKTSQVPRLRYGQATLLGVIPALSLFAVLLLLLLSLVLLLPFSFSFRILSVPNYFCSTLCFLPKHLPYVAKELRTQFCLQLHFALASHTVTTLTHTHTCTDNRHTHRGSQLGT